MARSGINKVILLGNLGADPELRTTAGGDAVATISIATSDSWKDKNTGEKKFSTQIIARDMQMLGSRNNSETQSNSSEEASMDQTPMDDEIPF